MQQSPVTGSDWQQIVADAFANEGPLAQAQPGFVPRAGQTDMAMAVAQVVAQGGALVVEAGTGVGKTYAYLVAALLGSPRVLLSTATKALQDQLYGRDLPHVLRALALPRRTALLKGRSSYLCLHRLGQARQGDCDAALAAALADVERWAQATHSGDLAELPDLDERSGVVPLVTSTRDNCLGASCPQARSCHVNRARRDAMAADVVVVNHHLLFADMAVRESGVAELLPTVHTVVVDEAHQLNEIGVQFLGRQLGSARLQDFVRDLLAHGQPMALGLADWQAIAAAIGAASGALLDLARQPGLPGRWRCDAEDLPGWDALRWYQALGALAAPLQAAQAALAMGAEHAPVLDRLAERARDLLDLVQSLDQPGIDRCVRWIECAASSWRVVESPHDIAAALRTRLMHAPEAGEPGGTPHSWVFTSATLGDDERLSWFTEPCGLQDARVLRVASPFDYTTQAALYVPQDMVPPSDPAHSAQVAALVAQAALVLGGRTLVLTTSLRALQGIGDALRGPLAQAQADIEVLVQGDAPKRWLMDRFRAGSAGGRPGCILVASASFWEGFDVPGDSLQLVVIDKLPFPVPTDPLVQVRAQRVQASGKSAFAHYFVAEAAVALKQGAGRLIRSESDRGVLVVCDPRLLRMGYGKRLLRALPPMPRLARAEDFSAALSALTRSATTISLCP